MATEYSTNYSSTKKSIIFLGNKNKVITFLPYLSDLSYSKKAEITENKQFWGDIILTNGVEYKFKLGFNVVSFSRNESIQNHKKFGALVRMVTPLKDDSSKPKKQDNNVCQLYVKFSNLIHNAQPNNYSNGFYRNFNNLKQHGVLCNIPNLNYQPDLEMGFFDNNGILTAKSFKIDLDLEVVRSKELYKKYQKGTIEREIPSKSPGRMFGFDIL